VADSEKKSDSVETVFRSHLSRASRSISFSVITRAMRARTHI